jgi:hypothetical protein
MSSAIKSAVHSVSVGKTETTHGDQTASKAKETVQQEVPGLPKDQQEKLKQTKQIENKFIETAVRARTDIRHETEPVKEKLHSAKTGLSDGASKAAKEAKKAAAPKITEEAKLNRGMKKPSDAERKEIHNAIQSGDKEKAIKLAIKYYGIDTSSAKGVKYDPNHPKIGSYSKETDEIKLGTSAFWSNGKISPDKLAAVIHHETIHARHTKDPKEEQGQTEQGRWAEHTEIWDESIRAAKGIDIEKGVLEEMELYRRDHYYGLRQENRAKVDQGKYDDVK